MKTTLIILSIPLLLTSLFSGCTSKTNPSIACYKGSPNCIAKHIIPQNNCLTCRAII